MEIVDRPENDPRNWYVDEHGWITHVGYKEPTPNITQPHDVSTAILYSTYSSTYTGDTTSGGQLLEEVPLEEPTLPDEDKCHP